MRALPLSQVKSAKAKGSDFGLEGSVITTSSTGAAAGVAEAVAGVAEAAGRAVEAVAGAAGCVSGWAALACFSSVNSFSISSSLFCNCWIF